MIYASEHLRKTARAARVFAIVLILIGVKNLVAGIAIVASDRERLEFLPIVGVLVAFYTGVAALMLWFATAILKVRRWAVIGTLWTSFSLGLLCALSAIQSAGSTNPVIQLVVMLPAACTAILCARALRDIKPQPKTGPRGFDVVKTEPPRYTMPIPPAASRLAPRRKG